MHVAMISGPLAPRAPYTGPGGVGTERGVAGPPAAPPGGARPIRIARHGSERLLTPPLVEQSSHQRGPGRQMFQPYTETGAESHKGRPALAVKCLDLLKRHVARRSSELVEDRGSVVRDRPPPRRRPIP